MVHRSIQALAFASLIVCSAHAENARPLYRDPGQPIEKRVEDLLGSMTLSEKVGQMNMPVVYIETFGRNAAEKRDACRKFAMGTLVPGLGPGGGFFTLADNALPEGPRQQAEFFNELQRIATEQTRLKIPLLQTEEGTHGVMCSGKTIFPEGPAIGSTWNVDLVRKIYAAAALEARAVGIHQLFTLVIEPNRDPRLGRNEEGYSEDPYLCARIAQAIVQGAQGKDVSAPDKVVAGLCHYPGQSQPVSGFERGSLEISERTLRNVFLPPWVAGISEGALAVMATHPAIDGVPTHSSDWLLTTLLREELGFQGLVLSEGSGIHNLIRDKVAADANQAGEMALKAGVDVGISHERAYMDLLIRNVEEGRVPITLIDRAVRRILTQKMRLGLFEKPYVDSEFAANGVPYEKHRNLALEVARQSIVLLKNEGKLLPLRKDLGSIAVIGPNADDVLNQLGDYTSGDQPNATRTFLDKVVTVLKGVQAKLGPLTQVRHVKGCDALGTNLNEIQEAVKAARQSEVALVVVGESHKGDGEMRDVASLDLAGLQEELIKAVHATGTPTVVVLINGRPLSVRWMAEHVPAIVEAWLPGEQGGHAVADVLFGDHNPSGRLPITIPRHVGQLPMYYNHDSAKADTMRRGYVDMSPSPLWEFGYGLSYTTFEYDDLRIEPLQVHSTGVVRVSFRVKNTGPGAGQAVVQLYLNDVVSSVARPVKELRRFEKVSLVAGESRRVVFELNAEDLSLLDRKLRRVVEPGTFAVMIGESAQAIRLRGEFEVKP